MYFSGINLETGETIEGSELADTTAFSIHLGIYRHRADVKSIMHTHPKYTTVLSVLEVHVSYVFENFQRNVKILSTHNR